MQTREEKLAYLKEWRKAHPTYNKTMCNKRYYAKREEILLEKKQYYEEHKQERAEYGKSHYARNRKKLIAQVKANTLKNKDKIQKYHQEYFKTHRDYFKEYHLKRKLGVLILEHVDKGELLKRYEHKCVYCGKTLNNDEHTHKEHLIPIIRYRRIGKLAPHSYAHVVPSCEDCNLEKYDKTPLEYLWEKESVAL